MVSIIIDCKILANDLVECSFVFINRLTNQVAHTLTKVVDSMSDQGIWMTNPPIFLELLNRSWPVRSARLTKKNLRLES